MHSVHKVPNESRRCACMARLSKEEPCIHHTFIVRPPPITAHVCKQATPDICVHMSALIPIAHGTHLMFCLPWTGCEGGECAHDMYCRDRCSGPANPLQPAEHRCRCMPMIYPSSRNEQAGVYYGGSQLPREVIFVVWWQGGGIYRSGETHATCPPIYSWGGVSKVQSIPGV